tara:strand:+ start:5729 stop:5932 length:204 start_codon:yes stop_codon:yes gene_type:complete
MSYPNIEYFSKMVKNTKGLRQKELRMTTDEAILLLSEITEILSKNENQEPARSNTPEVTDFDAGGFR